MKAKKPKLKSKLHSAGNSIFLVQLVFWTVYLLFPQTRKILVTYIDPEIMVNGLREEMRAICQFSQDMEQFTMKWIDEEGS